MDPPRTPELFYEDTVLDPVRGVGLVMAVGTVDEVCSRAGARSRSRHSCL